MAVTSGVCLLSDSVTVKPLRRRRSWYKRQIRNRRIITIVTLLVVVGAGALVISSMIPEGETESPRFEQKRKMEDLPLTPEENRYSKPSKVTLKRSGVLAFFITKATAFVRAIAMRSTGSKGRQNRDSPLAASALASQYWAGQGVPQDYNKAYFWYDVALGEGDPNAEAKLEELSGELTQDEVTLSTRKLHHGCKITLQKRIHSDPRARERTS